MSMAPGGAKLSAGQPFRVTEKYKPKSENIPIKKCESTAEIYAMSIIGGLAIAKIGELPLWGYSIAAMAGVASIMEFLSLANPYRKLFDNLGLRMGDNVPRYINKRKTDYGYCVALSLPVGLSTDDFKKHQLAIEQYLNRRVEFAYKNYRVYMKVFEKELDKMIPYEPIKTKEPLEFPVGVGFNGKVITLDLEKVVHLLIAGETGSGKSTLLRVILTSLILSNKRVSLHLIDLKNGAEFNVFRKCKQVKTFSRTKEDADKVLTSLINKVDRRYDLFFENNVVDIREYNKLKNTKKLDYQVVVIDEFADLQDEKGSISAVETLAAKARACGIYLIISTQRPSANIINGTIKANIPGVIGLKTMNGLNSRIIIDQEGLENLRGKGHGLLKYSELIEFQSMYLSNQEARELVKHTYVNKEKTFKKKEKPNIGKVKNIDFIKNIKR